MSRPLRFTVLVCGNDTVTVDQPSQPSQPGQPGQSDQPGQTQPEPSANNETASFNCGNAGMVAAGLLAAAGLAFVLLRKKH